MEESKKLKVGLVGVGHLGKIHLKLLSQSDYYEVVGIYDSNVNHAKEIANQFHTTAYNTYQELLDKVEVIDIVTPTVFHYEYALKAIENGIHFFIEKPVTQNVEEALDVISKCNQQKVLAQVGHVERFNPAFIASSPHFKNPKFVEIHRLAEFNPRGTDVSVVYDLMIHDLDILLSVVESPVKLIHANGVAVVSKSPDIANARIEFENGCVANLTTSRISMKNMRKARFFQKDAYISVDFLEKKTEIIRMRPAPLEPEPFDMIIENAEGEKHQILFEYPEVIANNAILDELNSFAQSILHHIPVSVSLEDGTQALKVAEEIMKQIQKNILL